jgi:hypothetical protein
MEYVFLPRVDMQPAYAGASIAFWKGDETRKTEQGVVITISVRLFPAMHTTGASLNEIDHEDAVWVS